MYKGDEVQLRNDIFLGTNPELQKYKLYWDLLREKKKYLEEREDIIKIK